MSEPDLSAILQQAQAMQQQLLAAQAQAQAAVVEGHAGGTSVVVTMTGGGEVTKVRLDTLRDADSIVVEEIKAAGLYRSTSQVFAVLLPVQSVGVMGDARTYEDTIAVRCVNTEDFMTADWSRLPYDLLAQISTRIINEVRGVNRVVYDISSKPPATIEWE